MQVNTSNEPSKYGLPSDEVAAFMQQLRTFDHLHVKGLMTLAEFSASADRMRACFVRLRQLRDRLSDDRGVVQAMESGSGVLDPRALELCGTAVDKQFATVDVAAVIRGEE